jgi:hypothetical protein
MMRNAELFHEINELKLSPEKARLSFEARLARENGWSRSQARRVIKEYKKFLYLVAISDRMLTPSEAVDQAWHLHMTFTRSYWDGLCAGVLGRPLHHEPTEGGPAEGKKFAAAYGATLAAYRAEFGAEPPAAIWPPASVRFLPPRQRWVDTRTHIIASKRSLYSGAAIAAGGLLAAASPAYAAEFAWPERPIMVAIIVVAGLLCLIAIVGLFGSKRGAPRQNAKNGGDGAFVYPYTVDGGGGGKGGGKGEADGDAGCGGGGGAGCGGGCGGGCGS